MKDRIRTFVLEGGYKAAILGAFVSHWCVWIVALVFFGDYRGSSFWQDMFGSGFIFMAFQCIFAIPSYYLLKFVVPNVYQRGLYHLVVGVIVGSILPLLIWLLYL